MREGSGINNEDMAPIAQSQRCSGLRHISQVVSGGMNIPLFVRANWLYAQARVEGVGNEHRTSHRRSCTDRARASLTKSHLVSPSNEPATQPSM